MLAWMDGCNIQNVSGLAVARLNSELTLLTLTGLPVFKKYLNRNPNTNRFY